jgi:hypothetical protein
MVKLEQAAVAAEEEEEEATEAEAKQMRERAVMALLATSRAGNCARQSGAARKGQMPLRCSGKPMIVGLFYLCARPLLTIAHTPGRIPAPQARPLAPPRSRCAAAPRTAATCPVS